MEPAPRPLRWKRHEFILPRMEINYCLRCGARYDVEARRKLEARHEVRCPGCEYTFYENPKPAVVALVRNARGKALFARRGVEPCKGQWGLPGGFMTYGEDPRESARREVKEELNVEAEVGELLDAWHEFYDNHGDPTQRISGLVLAFEATIADGPLEPGSDVCEAKWFPMDELPEAFAFPNQRTFLEKFQKGLEKFQKGLEKFQKGEKAGPGAARKPPRP